VTASLPPSQDDPTEAHPAVPPLPETPAAEVAASPAPLGAPRKPRATSSKAASKKAAGPRTPPVPRLAAAEAAARFADADPAVSADPAVEVRTDEPVAEVARAPRPPRKKRTKPTPAVPPESVPEEAAPEDAIPMEEPAPEEAAPEEAVPTEPAPEEAAPEEAVPTEPAPEETVLEEAVPEEDASPVERTVDDAALLIEPVLVEPLPSEPDVVDDVPVPMPVPDPEVDAAVPALRLRGVSKSFGETKAVDAIDLTIPAGTFYGIVGPNGAGKTTTLSMIAGLLRPDRGSIEIAGVDLAARPARAKKLMGILPDRLRTFDRLTGRQLLHYYGVLRGLRPAVADSRIADLARAFDLEDALGRAVADYSAGMTKKVMLAGAMIHSPRVLVLDEPFEAVDPVSSAVILDILTAYVAHGGTVVLSSHGMELVERVCSGVAVVVAGQVLAEGNVDEVRGELTLEQRFIELAGGLSDVEGLEWLHTFSG
jgi:ABC-2 type transport system ATP-binding protein